MGHGKERGEGKMKRLLIGFLLMGLAIGGIGTWFYVSKIKEPSAFSPQPSAEKKVLFYRHPMNPQVTSPMPQKDEMGMDYIAVYEEEKAEVEIPGAVRISPEKIQKIG